MGGKIHEELGKVVLPALDEAQNMAGGRTFSTLILAFGHLVKVKRTTKGNQIHP